MPYNPMVRSGVDHDLWIRLASNTNPTASPLWGLTSNLIKSNGNHESFISETRMTENKMRRIYEINKSLDIWRYDFERTFGVTSYRKFFSSYQAYLFYTFFFKKRTSVPLSLITAWISSGSLAVPHLFHFLTNKIFKKKAKFPSL